MSNYYLKGLVVSIWSVVFSIILLPILKNVDGLFEIKHFLLGYVVGYAVLFLLDSVFDMIDAVIRHEYSIREIILPFLIFIIYLVIYWLLGKSNYLLNNTFFTFSSFFVSAFSYRYISAYKDYLKYQQELSRKCLNN